MWNHTQLSSYSCGLHGCVGEVKETNFVTCVIDVVLKVNVLPLSSVGTITLLCHFHINDLMPVISCLTSLAFWSLFHVKSIPFCSKNLSWPYVFF